MSVKLSRELAPLMTNPFMLKQRPETRYAMAMEVDRAESYGDLAPWVRALISQARAELNSQGETR